MLKTLEEALKKPFLPQEHKERSLPGGRKWLFIPWQLIRKRLDQVYPDWEVAYSDPIIAGDLVVIRCRLTIVVRYLQKQGDNRAYSYTRC